MARLTTSAFSSLPAHLRYMLTRMGWPAWLGLALLAAALVMEGVSIPEQETQVSQLNKTRRQLRAKLANEAAEPTGQTLQLSQLPERSQIDALVEEMHLSARKQQVQLDTGEYRLNAESGTRLARYRMILPAKGSYVHIRAWLDEVAATQPGLIVDDMALKRENIGQENIEARISFSLLVRTS